MGVISYNSSPDPHYVYAMLCQDGEGPLYVKFGRSCDIERRLMQIRQGTPIPGRWFLYVNVIGPKAQGDLERGLHRRFKHRRTRGEWFKFDAYSDADKLEFRRGCELEYALVTRDQLLWRRIHIPTLEKKIEDRRKAFVHSKSKRQITAMNRRKRDARELIDYRKS